MWIESFHSNYENLIKMKNFFQTKSKGKTHLKMSIKFKNLETQTKFPGSYKRMYRYWTNIFNRFYEDLMKILIKKRIWSCSTVLAKVMINVEEILWKLPVQKQPFLDIVVVFLRILKIHIKITVLELLCNNCLHAFNSGTLFKSDSTTAVFLWI